MISAIIFYNQKGEVLISRLYRDGLRRSIADVFRIQVISNPESRSPVLTLGSTSFLHVKHENIYIVAVTRGNVDAALVMEFLYKLIALGTSYFNKLDESAIRNNFTLIYELLDEILDFGFPQNTETGTLKQYITTEGVRSESISGDNPSKITMQATGAISWRRPDVKYRKNEVFVDVMEDVNLLMSSTGSVLKADVNGHIQLKAHLSGMPECKFGLNDSLLLDDGDRINGGGGPESGSRAAAGAVTLEDCQFHQCVKLGRFDANRIISFTPPDGEFELMRYRAVQNINLPFKVLPQVTEIGQYKVEYTIAVKANFGPKLFATDVAVKIPTPLNTAATHLSASNGRAKYVPAENQIVWKIGRFTGGSEHNIHCTVDLTPTTVKKPWSRPPISMDFSLSMFTSSGIVVRYLKIFEKQNYTTVKWVRYLVRAGSYEIRF
ncbi:AP-2 complex subunit mu [Trichomonascus vanleenenianus]|uniref:Apm4p n=1 Tax=Trichomonascus vanleenenianus TaxID=2268995 RepID=UPI003EC98540